MEIKYLKVNGELRIVQVFREKRIVEFISAKSIDEKEEFYFPSLREEELLSNNILYNKIQER